MVKQHQKDARAALLNLLRQMRLESGLRQEELADRLGRPQSFVSKYETGERRLDVLELRAICEACGVPLAEFSDHLERLLCVSEGRNGMSTRGSVLERHVAHRYRQEGYDVVVHPSADAFPFDLDGFEPDLIATRGDEKLIIQVRNSVMSGSIDRLIEAADRVRNSPPWQLLLVTEDDVPGAVTPGEDLALPTWEEIHHRLAGVDQVMDRPAGLLLGWVVVEAALRRHAFESALPIQRLPTSALIKLLYTQGELPADTFETLIRLHHQRNRLAHGFALEDTTGAAGELRAILEHLLDFWRQPA
ncbi:helix-turn-helix domain-containing protein [Longimicrobium sp.]|uniref:helix-turn-helix domain-containing protein n=1 Tax=Longimicrobium sp. TaxID=2029185 RepID=UPI002F95EA40